ncbi:MAG TPA: hypothetical protein VFG55_01800, partial [Rhodanobacteraceae bacterium]|nr:hypothetical protein [Rhodanobacteraceae bacterium]
MSALDPLLLLVLVALGGIVLGALLVHLVERRRLRAAGHAGRDAEVAQLVADRENAVQALLRAEQTANES